MRVFCQVLGRDVFNSVDPVRIYFMTGTDIFRTDRGFDNGSPEISRRGISNPRVPKVSRERL